MLFRTLLVVAPLALALAPVSSQTATVSAADGLRRWHAVALTFAGPPTSESGVPNPFLDYRLDVTFSHAASGTSYVVPGHFAADGAAAESSADSGDRWRAWLAPDRVGTWSWAVSFRTGPEVAIADDATAGVALAPYDGMTGTFEVLETDKSGRDHRAHGRLRYVDRHHLQYADGTWFLKAGSDSPENLLAYDDIDNTPNVGNRRKSWSPHVADWQPGDPTWQGTKGRGLIGALNYLASEGLNAFSFLTYNHNGDDRNVFPHVDPNDRTRMDCSKLDQWDVVLTHGDRLGLYLHFKTQEQENDQDMDGGALGVERKLYYRELVSRFAHHLALNWNLGEENTNTTAQRVAFAQWFADLDPYDHPIVVHTFPGQKNAVYTPLLGSGSVLAGASLQSGPSSVLADTRTWRERSAMAGRPWVITNDEQGNAQTGIRPDADDPTHDASRRDVLWGNLIAGGAGIECYFGYGFADSDLTCEDFRSRDVWWDQCRYALEFFRENRVPFQDMANDDALVSQGHCLAGAGHWVVYLDVAGTGTDLDLSAATAGDYSVEWYDPRAGGPLQAGSVVTVSGGGVQALGAPPNAVGSDWVVLVRSTNFVGSVVERYGVACAGGAASVSLQADGLPTLGNTDFGVRAVDGEPFAPAALLVGFGARTAFPVGGCTFLVAAELALASGTDAGGAARYGLVVPDSPALLGFVANFQAVVADSQGPLLGALTTSDAVEIVLGR